MRSQQDQVYVAQRQCPEGRRFPTIGAAEDYLDGLINAPWWGERFPTITQLTLDEHDGAEDRHGGVAKWEGDGWGRLELTRSNFFERSLLHEVAHVCATAEMGDGVGHGPHWCRLFLELVYRQMGPEAWTLLRNAFLEGGVELD